MYALTLITDKITNSKNQEFGFSNAEMNVFLIFFNMFLFAEFFTYYILHIIFYILHYYQKSRDGICTMCDV